MARQKKPKKPLSADKKAERKKRGNQGGGRRALWDELEMEKRLKTIEGWAKQGLTNDEMAEALGVSRDMIYKWQREQPAFKEAMLKGKFESNGEILASAFRQATGYYQHVTEPFKVKTVVQVAESNSGRPIFEEVEEVIDHSYMKYFPPNQTMAIFMLKNRLPEFYKDKQDMNHMGQVGVVMMDDIPTPEQKPEYTESDGDE